MAQPINLVTGTPGAGKSLFAIQEVENLHKETGRPVYFHNIPGINISHWIPIEDPEKWYELPHGAIIIMDEAQQVFRQRTKEKVPEHVQKFETTRHQGYTTYLITQHPRSIDVELRRRIGRHVHLHRVFGMERATKYEWQEVQEEPRDGRSKAVANKADFSYPKEVYEWYKSADMHTIQKKLPWKKLAIYGALACIMPFLMYYGFTSFKPDHIEEKATAKSFAVDPRYENLTSEEFEAMQWALQFKERVRGQPHSPQFYDSALKPAAIPKIKGCGEIRSQTYNRCWCNTQQGTVITSLTVEQCRHYLVFGWFDPTQDDDNDSGGGNGHKGGNNSTAGGGMMQDPFTQTSGGEAAAGGA